jgi:NAD(P) transhydrogenase subunit alpha
MVYGRAVIIAVPREMRPGETRVAATPETVKRFVKEGFQVAVEAGAGERAFFADAQYGAAGAKVVEGAAVYAGADIVLRVAAPGPSDGVAADEVTPLGEGALLIGFLAPHKNHEMVRRLAARKVTALSMELVPRISRAQTMDALSSQASIGGYKAVLLAASHLGKYFPLLMTAAGTIQPAKIVVMGAGVAGLQAVATARRLGAMVEVSDIRAAVREEVESLGGRFIELPPMEEKGEGAGGYARQVSEEFLRKQREIVAERVAQADVVITTALVPGKPAPKILTEEMVKRMRSGAVVVDLAVEQGGNCELTVAGETVVRHGVTILGPHNLPATVPQDASTLYARNLQNLILLVSKKGELKLDFEDEIVRGALLTHAGEVRHAPTAEALKGGKA